MGAVISPYEFCPRHFSVELRYKKCNKSERTSYVVCHWIHRLIREVRLERHHCHSFGCHWRSPKSTFCLQCAWRVSQV